MKDDDDDDDIFDKSKMTRLRAVYWNANLMMGEGMGGGRWLHLCAKSEEDAVDHDAADHDAGHDEDNHAGNVGRTLFSQHLLTELFSTLSPFWFLCFSISQACLACFFSF